ncbi:PucR family transcriptional regulator [Leucobacter komagatae]|nr:helix-turn-helix domain-containing protein [Leucobacter komagatae]
MYGQFARAEELDRPHAGAIPLSEIATALDAAVRELVPAEPEPGSGSRPTPRVHTVALAEFADLASPVPSAPPADLVLPVGVAAEHVATWLRGLGARPDAERPVALMVKEDIDGPALRAAASEAGLAMIVVDRMARWDLLLAAIHRRLERAQSRETAPPGAGENAAFSDLAELASVIAAGAGGMVTIERPDSSVLAYSPSDGTADGLRARAILGRVAPEDSMVLLGAWGVVKRIQNTTEVVAVPAHAELGMRPRLVTGIHSPSGQFIGSIWVQEGANGFSPDAETVVRGGASAASRVLTRELEAPSATELMLQRVFGERGGIDAGTASAFLGLPTLGDAALIGIALPGAAEDGGGAVASVAGVAGVAGVGVAGVAKMLRLHVGAFAPQARFVLLGERAYVLLPNLSGGHRLEEWAEMLVAKFDAPGARSMPPETTPMRVAIVAPVTGFEEVAGARAEADRVLDAIAGSGTRVTSLTQSRTSVLLREAFELLGERPELIDPRFDTLRDYDERHGAELVASLRRYVDTGFNAREAARLLGVHPNTLRYRLQRAQEITGLDLSRTEDRLLAALQLELAARAASATLAK